VAASKQKSKYRVGQWILLPFAPTPLKVQILEDMGPLGIDGEHVFFVLVPGEEGMEDHTRCAAESRVIGPA
jgi:hypothetical protein